MSKSLSDLIKIGIIGPEFVVDKTLNITKGFPSSACFLPFPYQDINSVLVTEAFRKAERQVDIVLCTGPLIQAKIDCSVRAVKPTICIPYSSDWLFPPIFKAKNMGFNVLNASIDAFSVETVHRVYQELNLNSGQLLIKGHNMQTTTEELVRFHTDLYKSGRTEVAISSISTACELLIKNNIPCFYATPTRDLIYETCEKAYFLGESFKNRESQIVVGYIKVDTHLTNFDFAGQYLMVELYKTILDYAREIDGHLISLGNFEFQLFTTRGLFEKSTNWLNEFPLINRIKKKHNIFINVGIGFGRTANQAANNAKIALDKSLENGQGMCFVALENMRLIGPIGNSYPQEYELQTTDPSVLQAAEKVNISAVTLQRIKAIADKKGVDGFSAYDLEGIGLSIRSVHRTLKKLLQSGYLEIIGEVKINNKGRPRQIYQFKKL